MPAAEWFSTRLPQLLDPAAKGAASSSSNEGQQRQVPVMVPEIHAEIRRIYEQHAPGKVDGLPKVFEKYAGYEEQLLESVIEKYIGDTTPAAATVVATASDGADKQHVNVIQCVQRGGEAIFVPEGWGHAILNLQPSVGFASEFEPRVTVADGSSPSDGASDDDSYGDGYGFDVHEISACNSKRWGEQLFSCREL